MSLERKDLRVYFDAELHGALLVPAEVEGLEPAKLVERLVGDWVLREARRASLISSQIDVQGLSRSVPVDPGVSGVNRTKGGAR